MRLAALGLALILAGCGASAATTSAPHPAAGWTTYRSAVNALTVRFPSDWHLARHRLTPSLIDPVEVLTVATFPLRRARSERCAQVPERAIRDIGASDVLLSVQERRHPVGMPDEPPRLGPPARREWAACAGRRAALEEHWTTFKRHGRGFHLYVAFGPRAGALRREQVERILASLRVRARVRGGDVHATPPDGRHRVRSRRAVDALPPRASHTPVIRE